MSYDKLLQQPNSGFKRVTRWNKCLSKPKLLLKSPCLNHLVELSFEGVNGLFVLAFKDDAQKTSKKIYFLPDVEIKDHNVMIDGKNFFDQPIS